MAAPMKVRHALCSRHWRWLLSRQYSSIDTEESDSLSQRFKEATELKRPLCRTTENQPANQSLRQEGLFFTVEDDAMKYYNYLTPRMIRWHKAFNETSLMVRKPALELMQYLKQADYRLPVIRYILYGEYGNGKSSTISHTLNYCGSQGWIIAYVPWAAAYNRTFGETQQSGYKAGRLDTPIHALRWLTYFKSVNGSLLNDLKIKNHYTWTKRERAEEGDPLMESIEFGINRPKYACDVVGLIVKELKGMTASERPHVIFAIDGVNAFWQPTTISREEKKSLKYDGEELSLIHNFKKILSNDWSHGAVLCSVDRKAQIKDYKEGEIESDYPRYLLGEKGFAHLEPFIPVYVPPYSDKEIHSALEYLYDRKWFSNPKAMTDDGKKEIIFMSQHNPKELMNIAAMW